MYAPTHSHTCTTHICHIRTHAPRRKGERKRGGEFEARQSLLKISRKGVQRKDLRAQHLRVRHSQPYLKGTRTSQTWTLLFPPPSLKGAKRTTREFDLEGDPEDSLSHAEEQEGAICWRDAASGAPERFCCLPVNGLQQTSLSASSVCLSEVVS